MKTTRRSFLVALSAIPVTIVTLKSVKEDALFTESVTSAAKSTHVMADEVSDWGVGESMSDHITDAYRYVVGYNETLRAKSQRELNIWLRDRVDNIVFRSLTS